MPYIMPTRSEAVIFFEQEFDVTRTLEYAAKRKAEFKESNISMFYLILYAAIRVIAQRPKMNRFVSGFRFYQRNRIMFNFVAKRELSDAGEEINVTMSFSPFLSLEEFCKKIHDFVLSLKKGSSSDAEKLNSFLAALPRFCVKFAFSFVKFHDYHNALPKSVIDSLPFYCSVFFFFFLSVGSDAPFHHNFELGNCGIFCAVGKIRKENRVKEDGTVESRDKVKITFTFDDRITDGIYCARAVDMVRDLVENPEKLEVPLELTQEQLSALGLAKSELAVDGIPVDSFIDKTIDDRGNLNV
jgi:hypothetical protein